MAQTRTADSVSGVCDVERWGPADGPPEVVLEVPHGATLRRHYDDLRKRLGSTGLPDGLEAFFFVNTDVGAPECAAEMARVLSGGEIGRPRTVEVVRGLLPRTFIDLNREIAGAQGRMTPGLAPYVRDAADIAMLSDLWGRYQTVADARWDAACAAGGAAAAVHTYAPRTVGIERIDDDIVTELRRVYEPGLYETWTLRPEADLITEDGDGAMLADRTMAQALVRELAVLGVQACENASYRLDRSTTGYRRSARWPGRTLCFEVRRDLLLTEFVPFVPLTPDPVKVAPIARAAATAVEEALRARGR